MDLRETEPLTAKDLPSELSVLADPAVSLRAFGKVVDQKTGEILPFDPEAITYDFQNAVVDFYSNPTLTEYGQARWPNILTARQMGKSTIIEACQYVTCAYTPGTDSVCIADVKPRAEYLHGRVHVLHQYWDERVRAATVSSREVRQMSFQNGSKMRVLSGEGGAVGIGQSPDRFHGCLHPDTRVFKADGTLTTMEALCVGDEIRTHTNAVAKVSEKWRTRRPTVSVKVQGVQAPLVCSSDHKHWTMRGMVKTGDLKPGDRLGYPRRKFARATRTKLTAPQPKTEGQCGHPILHLPKRVAANRAWGRLFGLYLAEGTILVQQSGTVAGVQFTVHRKEVARTLAWIGDVGLVGRAKDREGSLTSTVIVYSRQVGEMFDNYLGRTTGKHWPANWWTYPGAFLNSMVEGYLDGDGGYDATGTSPKISVTSICPQLVLTLREVALYVGLGWGRIHCKPAGVRSGRNEREAWVLTFTGDKAREIYTRYGKPFRAKTRWTRVYPPELVDDAFVWVKIEAMEGGPVEDLIDIEVDHPDHSFTLVQCATSNSEVAYWRDAGKQFSMIYPSMINRDHAIVGLECTPCPMNEPSAEWWRDQCMDAKNGKGRWEYMFFPFMDGKLNTRPWHKHDVLTNEEIDLLNKYGKAGLRLEHIAFRRAMLDTDAAIRRNPDLFRVYYPFDDVTCWLASGSGVFRSDILDKHTKRELVPWDGPYMEYEAPLPDAVYAIGADPAGFGARDHASFQVLKVWAGEWEQVAVFGDIADPLTFARKLVEVGRRYNNALIGVESNGVGVGALTTLQAAKYPNLYYHAPYKPGIPASAPMNAKLLAGLQDALMDELLVGCLHDEKTVEQLGSYRNDKLTEQSLSSELLGSNSAGRRRDRGHWDKISALQIACEMARQVPRRYKPSSEVATNLDNVVLFKDMTYNQLQEYRKKGKPGSKRRRGRASYRRKGK